MSAYEVARNTYWEAQSAFRRVAINRIADLIPEFARGAVLELNDSDPPRLALSYYRRQSDNQRIEIEPVDEVWDEIDSAAADMELHDWQEIDSLLMSEDDSHWIIERSAS